MTEHRTIGSWLVESGMYRAACVCGWRSPTWRTVKGAADSLQQHIKRAAAADEGERDFAGALDTATALANKALATHEAAAKRPRPNPDLPKLLRSIASGTAAQALGHNIIFNAAADELDYWRELEAAKVIGGRS